MLGADADRLPWKSRCNDDGCHGEPGQWQVHNKFQLLPCLARDSWRQAAREPVAVRLPDRWAQGHPSSSLVASRSCVSHGSVRHRRCSSLHLGGAENQRALSLVGLRRSAATARFGPTSAWAAGLAGAPVTLAAPLVPSPELDARVSTLGCVAAAACRVAHRQLRGIRFKNCSAWPLGCLVAWLPGCLVA
jgi:hypothetical protein